MATIEKRNIEIRSQKEKLENKIFEQRSFIIKKFKKDNYENGEGVYKEYSSKQIDELDEYWDKMRYLYTPNHKSIEPFYNISGIFDKRYIPYEFMENFLRPKFYNEIYRFAFQDKTYLSEILHNIKQPLTIVKKVEGMYYDKDFNNISFERAVKLACDFIECGNEILIKPNLSTMGKGIKFFKRPT